MRHLYTKVEDHITIDFSEIPVQRNNFRYSRACKITKLESHKTCVGHVGKMDCGLQCHKKYFPKAPTHHTPEKDITVTIRTRHCCLKHESPWLRMHFN